MAIFGYECDTASAAVCYVLFLDTIILDTFIYFGYVSLFWIRLDTISPLFDENRVYFWIRIYFGYVWIRLFGFGYVWIRLDTFGYVILDTFTFWIRFISVLDTFWIRF